VSLLQSALVRVGVSRELREAMREDYAERADRRRPIAEGGSW
jgi:hypothetical protein